MVSPTPCSYAPKLMVTADPSLIKRDVRFASQEGDGVRNEGAMTANIWMNFSLISQESSWFCIQGKCGMASHLPDL